MTQNNLQYSETVIENKGLENTIFFSLKHSLSWGLLSAIVLGSFFAGVWTFIPTEMLSWGSSKTNFLGYASHCPFSPISSFLLFGICLGGIIKVQKMSLRNPYGYFTFSFGLSGIFVGIISTGIDFSMLIFGAFGIVVGMTLGIIFGLIRMNSNEHTIVH
ncbi:MAG: hypothetical protein ACW967_09490 [Candidatus Hodarchaeales archaeon]|jgi:hypothetical protein